MGMKGKILFLAMTLIFTLVVAVAYNGAVGANQEKPIIVCTTNVLGSLVEDFVGDQADVVVLAEPGICPADYDMKPSDVYAVSRAEVLFYHDILGEKGWLDDLRDASGNENLTMRKIYGDWNTHEGARRYIRWTGGNLSDVLSIDFNATINSMLVAIDTVAEEIEDEADDLDVASFKVVCMKWQSPFVRWVGFDIVGEYGPPEMLSAGFVANLTATAKSEEVALVIDNLQVDVDFGASLASEVGAVHVVLTNFPGAVPNTENLAEMFDFNAEQLFDGIRTWENTQELIGETDSLKAQLAIFQSATAIVVIVAVVEAIWLFTRRRKP